jgi:hypothetical protein
MSIAPKHLPRATLCQSRPPYARVGFITQSGTLDLALDVYKYTFQIEHRRQNIIPTSQGRKNYNGKQWETNTVEKENIVAEYIHIHLMYINIGLDIYEDGPIIQGQSSK